MHFLLVNDDGINAIGLTEGSVSTSDMTISFLRPFRGKSFIVES